MRRNPIIILFTALLLALVSLGQQATADALDNQTAIGDLSEIKGIYDVRQSDPRALARSLAGIKGNVTNLAKEGVERDLVIAFMSHAVRFIHTDPSFELETEHTQALQDIQGHIAELKDLGVRMEACSTATRAFGVDNDKLLDGIKPVRSGFITLMGYQNNGYALVAVYD